MEVARASGGRRIIYEAPALVPILGSLIAQGKAKPMIVVMPLGYGTMEFVELGWSAWNSIGKRPRINSVANNDAECSAPVELAAAGFLSRKKS
jgi:enterochelin esterase family protein